MTLNRERGATPLYIQLEDYIREQIESGQYVKGDTLPSENEYMEMYQVSRMTVRQAMNYLVQNGFIKRQRGTGTIVTYEKISEDLHSVTSFTDEMAKHNIKMKTSYCDMQLVHPDTRVAIALGISTSDECYQLTRVRDVDNKPIVYTITYLKKLFELPLDSKYYTESLYKYLRDTHGVNIVRGRDVLEAELPNKQVQKMLQIKEGTPIFIRTRETFLDNDELFEYSICYYPGNRYKYTVEL